MNSGRFKLLGEILIREGHCTLAQVNEARRSQLNRHTLAPVSGKLPLFGEVVVQLGYVTPKQIEEALRLQAGRD
jgi:hypothetical protein